MYILSHQSKLMSQIRKALEISGSPLNGSVVRLAMDTNNQSNSKKNVFFIDFTILLQY